MRLRNWKYSIVFVVCYLCSHTDSSRSHRGLLAPVNITTKLIGDEVRVHWRDHNQPELVSGAYAAVSEVHGDKLDTPTFIHADNLQTKSITLSGLMPQITYSIRVVLFSKDGYSVSSIPVTVTMNSYLHEAQSATDSQVMIEVNQVTNHSAMLSWTFPVVHSIHGLQFKLNCKGQQTFLMNGRTVHKKYQTRTHISDALSKYTQEQLVEDLVPNVNYTCQLAAYNAASEKALLMATVHFTTLVGMPRTPEKPRVDVDNYGIKIFLIATADQFGPISHYTLIAVPVHKDKTQPITEQFTPVIPYNKVVGKAMPSHSASKSDKSVAFIIGTYPGNALPSEVMLGNTDEVLSAFKPNQFYVLVLAAFTKTKEDPKSLLSLSSPSFPPFVISNSLYMFVTQHAENEAVGEASRMVLWITGTIAVFGVAVVIVSLGVAYALKKKGYKIPLKLSEGDIDSEDYVELTVDKLVYGEKTYVPMKPVRSAHTHQSARVDANKFDNPHFDVSVTRTKGLLEDIQVAVDSPEAGPAVENPPQSPTEYCQPLTISRLKNEDISHTRSKNHSPFTYSTPGELEKLQTGAFSLPRSTGPIKTPRRRTPAVTKSPAVNKGIPTPAPCKPTTTNIDEETSVMASNEPPTMNDNDEDLEPMITDNDKHLPTAVDNFEQPSTIVAVGEPPIVANNDNQPLTMADNDQGLEPVTTAVYDEHQPATTDNVDPLTIADINEEGSLTTSNNYDELLTTPANNDESITTNINDKEPPITADDVEQPLTISNTAELLTTADNNSGSLSMSIGGNREFEQHGSDLERI